MFKLSNGDALFIKRRRAGLTQQEAAKQYDVCREQYISYERNKIIAPECFVTDVTDYELYTVKRRRAGLTQAALAILIGRSVEYIKLAEKGIGKTLILKNFWRNYERKQRRVNKIS